MCAMVETGVDVSDTGHVKANMGSWAAVYILIVGFVLGTLALILGSVPLWIGTAVALVAGAGLALVSNIMEQAY
ncbi:hypothetical protein CcI49_22900 [Frankia sp. CcI49]|uniref:Uncharacterized protein n=1 Tax=Parafrankia irregularis TaxID=795642 RepID=A0A0S4QWL1_9ACTN|nr:hypothetical protein ACG83_11210 [Frankia sp. R43]MBE3201895.1 hypothetical protein [Parafrankia sp. CH37]ONH58312.1 hypothetical protein CcI49_22900 [Frankia sp. CcI49]CUU59519.1 hypothetical protein Ga0074812_12891 [Parafrankia irregularis]